MLPVTVGAIAETLFPQPVYSQDYHALQTFFTARHETFPALPEAAGGVINVRDYGAVGDGVTDDTAAFQRALSRDDIANGNKILYIPDGTYLLSDTVQWPRGEHDGLAYKRTTVLGESQRGTILKLKDGAAGFGDRTQPKPLLDTGENRANGFRNRVENLTLDTGRKNPGAIALKFNSNNGGGVFDVQVRSGDRQGVSGLDLTAPEVGPLLVKNLAVTGFARGIHVGGGQTNSVHMENIDLREQTEVGIRQEMQVLTLRNLVSENPVPAVELFAHGATLALLGAHLTNTGPADLKAITTRYNPSGNSTPGERATMTTLLMDVEQQGYGTTAELYDCNTGDLTPLTGTIRYWSCADPLGTATDGLPFQVPVRETPRLPSDLGKVAIVQGNTGAAIQAAIDTPGVDTVFLPNRTYAIAEPVQIRGTVRRITGMGARISDDSIQPSFQLEAGDAPMVIIERLEEASVLQNSDRTLVVQKSSLRSYANTPQGTGDTFLEDIVTDQVRMQNQAVWARSLNVEGRPAAGEAKIMNDGGQLWVLGLKTEMFGTILSTRDHSKTDVIGGLIHINQDIPDIQPPQPQYEQVESQLAVLTRTYAPTAIGYPVLVRKTTDGRTTEIVNPNRRQSTPLFYVKTATSTAATDEYPDLQQLGRHSNKGITAIPEPRSLLSYILLMVLGLNLRRPK